MTLIELQKIIGDRINVTISDMSPEQMKIENEKSALVIGLSKQYISTQNTIIKAAQLMGDNEKTKKTIQDTAFLRQ